MHLVLRQVREHLERPAIKLLGQLKLLVFTQKRSFPPKCVTKQSFVTRELGAVRLGAVLGAASGIGAYVRHEPPSRHRTRRVEGRPARIRCVHNQQFWKALKDHGDHPTSGNLPINRQSFSRAPARRIPPRDQAVVPRRGCRRVGAPRAPAGRRGGRDKRGRRAGEQNTPPSRNRVSPASAYPNGVWARGKSVAQVFQPCRMAIPA